MDCRLVAAGYEYSTLMIVVFVVICTSVILLYSEYNYLPCGSFAVSAQKRE